MFLSHASEDKDDIARPLKDALEVRGVSVWFNELKIKVGQSTRSGDRERHLGCRFGVVIISPSFFVKEWTQAELDELFGKKSFVIAAGIRSFCFRSDPPASSSNTRYAGSADSRRASTQPADPAPTMT